MIFKPENIINQLDDVGPWSFYFLGEVAIKYYYKWYRGLYTMNFLAAMDKAREVEPDWRRLIVRFDKEVGFKNHFPNGFPNGYVNQY